jgi:hypothetical protein
MEIYLTLAKDSRKTGSRTNIGNISNMAFGKDWWRESKKTVRLSLTPNKIQINNSFSQYKLVVLISCGGNAVQLFSNLNRNILVIE